MPRERNKLNNDLKKYIFRKFDNRIAIILCLMSYILKSYYLRDLKGRLRIKQKEIIQNTRNLCEPLPLFLLFRLQPTQRKWRLHVHAKPGLYYPVLQYFVNLK